MIKSRWILFLIPLAATAAVVPTDGSRADVQAKHDDVGTVEGDILTIPAGTFTWSTEVSIAKAVTIQGAGIGVTVISNDQGTGMGTPNSGQYATIDFVLPASGRQRLTGLTIDMNQTATGLHVNGAANRQIQIDNCKFFESRGRAIDFDCFATALVFNCEFEDCFKCVDIVPDAVIADVGNSWASALTFGQSTGIVVEEDNTYTYTSWYPVSSAATSTRGFGARAVFRYNTWTNNQTGLDFYPILDCHGNQAVVTAQTPAAEPPGGTGNHRASRQFECYSNIFDNNGGGTADVRLTHYRGGTILHYSNTYTDTQSTFYLQEEDGDTGNNFLDVYPGYDQHRLWFWSNTRNAVAITTASFAGADDETFIIENTNLYFRSPESGDIINLSGYSALSYPHPWRGSTLTTGTLTIGP